MAQHSVADAARLVCRDRRTLYKDIQRGRLTATTSATGGRQVETSELIRVYGELTVAEATTETVSARQEPTGAATAQATEIAQLRAQVAALEARLADKQQHIDHLAQAMLLLEHRLPVETSQVPTLPRRSWLTFWRR